jgi:hypothetical protein
MEGISLLFYLGSLVGKGLRSLIGWTWLWRSSLLSCAPAALVGAILLLARQPLRSFVFITRLQLSSVESPAGCWRSRPFGRSRSSHAEAVGTPGMPAGILPGPWCAPLFIPPTLAPETGEVSWASMGLWRIPLLAEVLLALIEVPGFWSGLVALVVEAGSCEVFPAISGRAGSKTDPAGDCHTAVRHRLASWDLLPSGAGPRHHLSACRRVTSNRFWPMIFCGNHGGCLLFTRSWFVTKGVSCRSFVAEISN